MWVQACPCLAVGTHPVKSNRLLQVIFSENFGTEGRGGYFDQVGVQRREQWQAPPNCLAACQCDATCPLLQCSAFACLTLLTTPLPCPAALQYGIVRDVIQNHLLQILALFAMEQPVSARWVGGWCASR